MNLYVIGPVTGMPDFNRAAFAEARAKLVAAGHSVRTPYDFIPVDATCERAMRLSLHNLLDNTDGVALLDGWQESRFASIEFGVSYECGIPCKPVEEWVNEKETI